MAELHVDPADVGPRIQAALMSAASALAAPAAIVPPEPPGSDPVSVVATNRVAVNASKLSAQLLAGIAKIAAGESAVAAALRGYVQVDGEGAARVSGVAGAGGAAPDVPSMNLVVPPAVQIPDLPLDMLAALATVPGEPDVVDLALQGGAGAAGLEGHAAAWDSVASGLNQAAQSLHELVGSLPASWKGPTSEALSARLNEFGHWMNTAASAAGDHANSARQVSSRWSRAVQDHPRAHDYAEARQRYLSAAARANSGDVGAAQEAAKQEGLMGQMKTTSSQTMSSYGAGGGGADEHVNGPGDSPRIADGDPALPRHGVKKIGSVDGSGDEDLLSGLADDGSDPMNQSGQAAGQMLQTLLSIPTQVGQALGQVAGQFGQQLQQAGQQVGQVAQQIGSGMNPSSGTSGSGGGGTPRNPLGSLRSGAGGAGGGSGRTMPASLPQQAPAPAPVPPASTTAVPTGSSVRGGAGPGGAGMMPMGMMPPGSRNAEDKEIDRNTDWFPDEQLVKDDVEVSEPIAGQRKRARPTET
ncbi:PPE domain-containing protein [Mycobacteroides abscessus]|uniref:PPE domain-containing protein n=1 Tax=Mycobacteroides abscessus TaxID=36809 RepID=UPI0009407C68|nr:PPE domain-containing protein [Mycobacteroides abscessus]QSN49730.1 PPE domain-containing protein [Mycobacteroides abscessus subsp. abscessus]